jgi:molecular chaperone GrpE (heat shock protein)
LISLYRATIEEDSEKVIKTLSEEISNFHQILQDEIEQRDRGYESLYKQIMDVQSTLISELDTERADREDTEESMIKVLEDVGLSCD